MKETIIEKFGNYFKVRRIKTDNGLTVSVLMFKNKKDLTDGNSFNVREGFTITNYHPVEKMIDARIIRLYKYYTKEKKF